MRSIDGIDVTDRKSRPCRDIDSTSFAQKQGRRIDSISLDIMSDHVTLLQLLYDITSEWPETLNICMVRTTLTGTSFVYLRRISMMQYPAEICSRS